MSISHWTLNDLTLRPDWRLHWQMSLAERLILQSLLERIRPTLSVEIGTYKGGSLQAISALSEQVISVDIDPEVEANLKPLFSNVEFRSGDSATLVPELVEELNSLGEQPDFVLIDGDHSAEAVRRDANAMLRLRISKPLLILMHDSFNPNCRAGIAAADWAACPSVKSLEMDLVQGVFFEAGVDTAANRSMWGGFACAVLHPERRVEPLAISRSCEGVFQRIYRHSSHRPSLLRRLRARLLARM